MKNIITFLFILWTSNYSGLSGQEIKKFDLVIAHYIHEPMGSFTTTINNQSLKKNNRPPNQKPETTTELTLTPEQEKKLKKLLKKLPLKKREQEFINKEIADGSSISFEMVIDGKKYEAHYINYPLHQNFQNILNFVNEIIPHDKITYSKK